MLTEDQIIYQNGAYWVVEAQFKRSSGYVVYKDGPTHAVVVATIGYPGEAGLHLAITTAETRAREDARGVLPDKPEAGTHNEAQEIGQ